MGEIVQFPQRAPARRQDVAKYVDEALNRLGLHAHRAELIDVCLKALNDLLDDPDLFGPDVVQFELPPTVTPEQIAAIQAHVTRENERKYRLAWMVAAEVMTKRLRALMS